MQVKAEQPVLGKSLGRNIILGISATGIVGSATLLFQHYAILDPGLLATLGYPAIFLTNALGSQTLFLPVPGLAAVFAGGTLLHPVLTAVVAAAGMTAGMVGSYVLGITACAALQRVSGGKDFRMVDTMAKVGCWLRRSGIMGAILIAAIPNPFFDFAGLIAGSVRISLTVFLLGIFMGKLMQALAVALIGFYLAGSAAPL